MGKQEQNKISISVRLSKSLLDKIDNLVFNNHSDRTTEITKACEKYINEQKIDQLLADIESDPLFLQFKQKYDEMQAELERQFLKYAEEMKGK